MISKEIKKLVQYGINTGLLPEAERIYAVNLLLQVMQEDEYEDCDIKGEEIELESILKALLDEACEKGIVDNSVTYRDLFDTRLMNCIMPRPAQVQQEFADRYAMSPKEATDYFYKFSQDCDYIRRYRVAMDQKWNVDSPYGEMDITINLSKPEKDPKAIAAAGNAKQSGYPKCQLCMENEGYAGRADHPARENHRIIPVTINGTSWGFQYSPYVYYNEHCIVFNGEHIPMKIDRTAFVKLFDFVKLFPHYILGSNADLPIVGGSILSHDHFQGGNYLFPMAKAKVEEEVAIKGYEDIYAGIVKWPMSVLRLRCKSEKRLIELSAHVLEQWRSYTDENAFVFAETNGEPHNTITPIVRMAGGEFEIDLVLRNNITTEEHPMGLYHPHANYHHIKKENIGLIEVMGLAVLPARLKEEMEVLADCILNQKDYYQDERTAKHGVWADAIQAKYGDINKENIMGRLQEEIGIVFTHVLEDAGVYKCDAEGRKNFKKFLNTL